MSLDPLRLSENVSENVSERSLQCIVGGRETGGYARRAASSARGGLVVVSLWVIYSAGVSAWGAISIGQEREIRGGTAQDAWLRRARRGLGMGTVKSGYTRVAYYRVKTM